MSERKGTISVHTSDIFPIIKKWLYSEHDIFLRELVANSTDAITKRATISRTQNREVPTGSIDVVIDKKERTIKIIDNGIGMTDEEVEKYIAQLAFSGAEEFIKKMKDAGDSSKDEIIGKFGLGFFSSFMVSDKVVIDSLSMSEDKGVKPTRWTCEGTTDYTFSDSDWDKIGTCITLHINDDGEEFLDSFKTGRILNSFCDFMPYTIQVTDVERMEENQAKLLEEEKKTDLKEEDKTKPYEPNTINDTEPLWRKDPSTLKDEDYINFFHQLYPTDPTPLFWLHLKVDHPFTLEGILYFPKINPNRNFNESNIRLYCKQVYVSDNVKNIIPDFLSLLKGAIDSTDIPLNISRSSLQGDPNIKRISNYVVKKVAESLKKLYTKDRPKYEQIWEDIGLFVKYGAVSDTKFDELMRDLIIFKNSEGKYMNLKEYRESIPDSYKDKMKETVLYFEKDSSDWSLRKQLLAEGIHAIETDSHIDPHFIQHVEVHKKGEETYKFSSVDSEISSILGNENTEAADMKIKDLFHKVLVGEEKKEESKDDGDEKEDATQALDLDEASTSPLQSPIEIEIGKFKSSGSPAYFKVDEQMKRFRNMAKSMGQTDSFPIKKTLVINPNNELVKNALAISEKGNEELADRLCHHVEDLATISSEGLKEDEREKFVQRSEKLIGALSKFALE